MIKKSVSTGICLVVAACGSSSSSSNNPPDGGTEGAVSAQKEGGSDVEAPDAAGDDSGPVDSSLPDGDAGASSEGGGPPPGDAGFFDAGMIGDGGTPYVGLVVFAQLQQQAYSYSYITIDVAAQGALRPPLACPRGAVVAGGCCYAAPAPADAGTVAPVSAGTIDTFDNYAPLVSIPFGAQGYAPSTTSASLWLPADQLRATAAGAIVNMFSAVVVAPEPPANMVPGGGMASASISADWTVTWTPDGAGQQVVGKLLTNSHGSLQCVTSDSGTLTFPASLMRNLTAPETGTFELSRVTYASASAANASVQVAALMGGAVAMQYTP